MKRPTRQAAQQDAASIVSGSPGPQRRRMRVKIACLKSHPLQGPFYRTSGTPKIEALAANMKKIGQTDPVLVMPFNNKCGLPGGTLIDGHDRVAAALLLGWTHIDAVILDDLKDADASAVETMYLSINLTRKHLDRLDQARALRRLYEIEKGRKPGSLREGEEREARDRSGKVIGMSGKNLERYWNVLKAPLEVQRAFQAGSIKLEYAARIGLLQAGKQAEVVCQLHGVIDAKAIKRIAEKALEIERAGRHKNTPAALDTLSRNLEAGLHDLEGRVHKIRPDDARSHAPVLKRTADLIQSLLSIAAQV